jgi:hypothetical protein
MLELQQFTIEGNLLSTIRSPGTRFGTSPLIPNPNSQPLFSQRRQPHMDEHPKGPKTEEAQKDGSGANFPSYRF